MPKAIVRPKSVARRVALAYPVSVPWAAMFVRGVIDFAQGQGGWSLVVSPPALGWAGEQPLTLAGLKDWPGDGVIAAIGTPAEVRAAGRLGKPVVNIAATLPVSVVPRVRADHYGMGRMAAEHLLERGLRRLAFYGFTGFWFSQQRRQGLVDRAAEAGVACDVLEVPGSPSAPQSWQKRIAPLTRFLKRLKPPVGLLAVQDYRARTVIDECQRLGLRIPHDVAVIGIDDDPTICEFCRPTLSSVSRNSWRLGYETAAMLAQLMAGRAPPEKDLVVPCDDVVARQSTDTIAIEDPQVAAAVHFIHDHPGVPFGVDRVVEATTISRRLLEVRFREALSSSIYDYLCRQRLQRASQLLAAPERVKLHKVAAMCGFSNAEQMRLVFKRLTGLTPLEYRLQRA